MSQKTLEDFQDNIYSSVDIDIDYSDANKNKLRQFLYENPNKVFTATELSDICGFKSNMTAVNVRKAITELLEIELMPIIANSKGFQFTNNPKLVEEYLKTLDLRVQGIKRREMSLRNIKARLEYKGKWVLN